MAHHRTNCCFTLYFGREPNRPSQSLRLSRRSTWCVSHQCWRACALICFNLCYHHLSLSESILQCSWLTINCKPQQLSVGDGLLTLHAGPPMPFHLVFAGHLPAISIIIIFHCINVWGTNHKFLFDYDSASLLGEIHFMNGRSPHFFSWAPAVVQPLQASLRCRAVGHF